MIFRINFQIPNLSFPGKLDFVAYVQVNTEIQQITQAGIIPADEKNTPCEFISSMVVHLSLKIS
jgi:hypothetical protein